MRESDPKQKFKTSSSVLQSLFEGGKSPMSEQFLRWKLWMKWKDVVGATMAEHTEPVGLQRKVLYVWVKNSVWMQQMTFVKGQLIQTIGEKFKKDFIRDIRFTLDRKSVPGFDDQEFKDNVNKVDKITQKKY